MLKLDIEPVKKLLKNDIYYRDLDDQAAISYISILLYNDVVLLDLIKEEGNYNPK